MNEEDQEISADDWGAAMAEQAAATSTVDPSSLTEAHALAEERPFSPPLQTEPHVFQTFGQEAPVSGHQDLEMIMDIPVNITVELGRTKMPIKNLLQLAQGSVVELSGMAGEPLDVLVNGFLIAQGEVVVVNEKFGIRLTDIITPSERMRRLNR
ncbi:flagellar motor switch protein FliN [Ferrovum myxofaciens]|uniref:Flagellar motor switch protein FliN n=1 Tax=Ferrovum myxofaciens TaxID=416213 RepID=A0A8F3DX94_9PROT|nr:flagellar motor switch protein FliN [Ferrovum myxofaciens]KXW58377.1 flagellar motor switch protein FliN [Ferrovum myxofaciens]MBU6994706.1 flagellar motor switch protein FliN [Ferrovum myxofaciens]QKE38554.1 MAG: flagellar motor switch protein FliN [Ferrovum myxofaciens]QWY73747.1 MAG: flagellar motor switch protein FliN [Ferrovum myxofaciens]QWY76501.1 MAG: flagellar motor switch protein FliN [Ferrovum myxofaciens]